MIRALCGLIFVFAVCGCQGGASVNPQSPSDEHRNQSQAAIKDSDVENWVRIRLVGDEAHRLSILENFDAEKDASVFCGRKDGEIRCAYYQAVVENTSQDAWGYTRGTIVSRKIISLNVPAAAKFAQSVSLKDKSEISYTNRFFCVNSAGQDLCWFYNFQSYLSLVPEKPCSRDRLSLTLNRILYMGAPLNTCAGAFVEQDGFQYHFYGTEHQEDKYSLRVERCSLDGQLDKSFGNDGNILIYHSNFSAGHIKIVTRVYNGYLIGSAVLDQARIAKLDLNFDFAAGFTPIRFEPGNYFPSEPKFTKLSMNKERTIEVTMQFSSRSGVDEFSGVIPSYGGKIENLTSSSGPSCAN